jgi:glycosyltransferase 2 family protein
MLNRLRPWILPLLKLLAGGTLLAFLLYQAQQHELFSRLVDQPKDWRLLMVGVGLVFVSITFSFVRWWLLARALDLNFQLPDALRLGSIGFALNFVALGNVGGDLFKAALLAREQRGRRTEAVASVVIDRVMGLTSMLVLASVAIFAMGTYAGEMPLGVKMLCRTVLIVTGIGLLGIMLIAASDRWAKGLARWMGRLPAVGSLAVRVIGAVVALRRQPRLVLSAIALCLFVDATFILSVYAIAQGLPIAAPGAAAHFLIVPVSSIAGALPITPNGLGTTEAAMDALYLGLGKAFGTVPGDGTIVALAHRLAMMAVGAVALGYFLTRRAELNPMLREAEAV